jgi:hypothetical protein
MTHEAAHVLAADQRNVFAELFAIEVNQAAAVFAFLRCHLGKDPGCSGIVTAQPFRHVGVDAAIFLFVADSKGKNLLLAQFVEVAHALLPPLPRGWPAPRRNMRAPRHGFKARAK